MTISSDNTGTAEQISVNGLQLAALRHQNGSAKHKLLCVHGWLDNANSFIPLMPHLDDCDIVAIDLPGHGYSEHLPEQAQYHIADMPFLLLDTATALGWNDFHLVGHSLGGCIAAVTAAAAPEALQSMVMLEASGPVSEAAEDLPARLKKVRQQKLDHSRFESRLFSHPDEAIASRRAAAKMQESSAQLIIDRQLIADGNGWRWRFDVKHRLASPVYMTETQVLAVLSAIECQTLAVIADEGYIIERESYMARLEAIEKCQVVKVEGHHHMHMDDPISSAIAINQHLSAF